MQHPRPRLGLERSRLLYKLVEITARHDGRSGGVGDAVQQSDQSTRMRDSLPVEQDRFISCSVIIGLLTVRPFIELL